MAVKAKTKEIQEEKAVTEKEKNKKTAKGVKAPKAVKKEKLVEVGDTKAPRTNFEGMTDEEIVAEVHLKNNKAAQRYLLEKYKKLVVGKSKGYFFAGGDREDVIQEGMIGLFKAIRDFSPAHKSSFKNFADLCVGRQIITALKTATRQKQSILNESVSMDKPVYADDTERTLLDVLSLVDISNPEQMLVDEEEFKSLEGDMSKILTELEWHVLRSYLDEKSYQEIAQEVGRDTKSIDNAMTRVKRKIAKYQAETGNKIDPRVMQKGLIALTIKAEEKRKKSTKSFY